MRTEVIRINVDATRDTWVYNNSYSCAYNLASHIVQTVYDDHNFWSAWFKKRMDEVQAQFRKGGTYLMWFDPSCDGVTYMCRHLNQ